MSASFPFTDGDSCVTCEIGVMQTLTQFERDDVIVSSDHVMVKCGTPSERLSSSLQKGIRHSAVPWTAAEKHRCHCLSNAWVCTCVLCVRVFVCICSGVQQMPQFKMSLKCVPDRQLALPYLTTAIAPQLASNQYLLQPAMNHYELPPHLCSAT